MTDREADACSCPKCTGEWPEPQADMGARLVMVLRKPLSPLFCVADGIPSEIAEAARRADQAVAQRRSNLNRRIEIDHGE